MIQTAGKKGTLTANSPLVLSVDGLSVVAISLRGTFSATIAFEATVDGINWFALNATPVTGGTVVTSATGTGEWLATVAGFLYVRCRVSAYTSGSPTAFMRAVAAGGGTGGSNGDVVTSGADGRSNTANSLSTEARIMGFNGTTWDRIRTAITTATSTFTGILNTFNLGKYNATPPTLTDGQAVVHQLDSAGNLKVTQATLIAGEDLTNNLIKTEAKTTGGTKVTADTLVKSGAGFLHALTFTCNDAAPTAGSIIAYDNTAESGTELVNHTFTTTPFAPLTVLVDVPFATGLYIGFTTTNDVNVLPSYR